MRMDYEEHGFRKIKSNEHFSYDCSGCGDCCRNVRDSIMIESLDIYRLARYFGMEMSEVILQYMDTAFLAWGFPVFMLKTKPYMDSCVFLKGSHCKVQEAKPRTCRLYPLGIGPDDEKPGTWLNLIVSKKQHHFTGRRRSAGDWINENLAPEDLTFVMADYKFTGELAKLMKRISRNQEDKVVELILFYKYVAYAMAEDFQTQYTQNMEQLKKQFRILGK